MTAPTPRSARSPHDQPAWYADDDVPTTRHRPVDTAAVPAPATPPRRTVSMRIAAAIGVVAFLLGAGLAMLTGPLLGGGPDGPGAPGGPGTPGAPGGPGGAPGTSQQQSGTGSSSGTSSAGAASTGTNSSSTGT